MANKPTAALVMSMAEISKLTVADAASLFAVKTTTVSRAFMDCAKLIVHIQSKLLPSQTVFGLLEKKGVRKSTIRNAQQAARVWNDLVERELVTEKQFEKLSYMDFVAINSAVKEKGVHNVGPLVAAGDLDEVEFIAEHKMTTAEKKGADAKKASKVEPSKTPEKTKEGEKVTTLTEPPKPNVTTLAAPQVAPEPVVEAPKPPEAPVEISNIVEMKPAKLSFNDARLALDTLTSVASDESLTDEEFLILSIEIVALANLVVDKEVSIRAKSKVA